MSSINPNLAPFLPPSFTDQSGNLTVSKAVAEQVASKVQQHAQALPPAAAQVFLSLLKSPDLAPSGGQAPANLDASLSKLEGAANTISSFLGLATDINILGKLMIMHANEQRKNALDQRLEAREEAKTNLLNQAGQDMKAAGDMRSGAIASLVLSVVSAAVSIGMAGFSMSKSAGAAKELKGLSSEPLQAPKATEPQVKQPNGKMSSGISERDQIEFDVAKQNRGEHLQRIGATNTEAQNLATMGQTLGGLGSSLANFANTEGQAESKEDSAIGEKDAAMAADANAQADMGKEVQQAADDMVKQIINLLKELKDSKAQEMQAITRA